MNCFFFCRLSEAGIIQLWFREMSRIKGERQFCDKNTRRENIRLPLTLENLSGSFYLLCFGHLLSLVAFVFEILFVNWLLKLKLKILSTILNVSFVFVTGKNGSISYKKMMTDFETEQWILKRFLEIWDSEKSLNLYFLVSTQHNTVKRQSFC